MKRMLFLLAMLLFVLCGCESRQSRGTEERRQLVVGFAQLGSESSWRIANTESMEKAAKEYGYAMMVENANQKQEKQIAAIRSFIAYRVDCISFSPIIETGWDNVLREAKQANIPVIIVDRMIDTEDDDLYAGYIGADFLAEGVRAGQYLVEKVDRMGAEHLNIVEVCGTEDSTPMRERHSGFVQVLDGDDRFTILETVSGDFLRSKGEEVMKGLLEKYGRDGIDVVYSHNDAMTMGILDVLRSNGIAAGTDIVIISVDGEEEAVQALQNGEVNCIVECTPDLGSMVMEMVKALEEGREIPKIAHPEEGVYSEFDEDRNWKGF